VMPTRRKSRRSRNKYLGKRVPDIGRPGLSNPKEFRQIAREIYRDYRAGRISRKQAQGRYLLLIRLTYKKNNSNVSHLSVRTLSKLRKEIKEWMKKL